MVTTGDHSTVEGPQAQIDRVTLRKPTLGVFGGRKVRVLTNFSEENLNALDYKSREREAVIGSLEKTARVGKKIIDVANIFAAVALGAAIASFFVSFPPAIILVPAFATLTISISAMAYNALVKKKDQFIEGRVKEIYGGIPRAMRVIEHYRELKARESEEDLESVVADKGLWTVIPRESYSKLSLEEKKQYLANIIYAVENEQTERNKKEARRIFSHMFPDRSNGEHPQFEKDVY